MKRTGITLATLSVNLHLNPIYPWQPFKFNSCCNPSANRQTKVATSFNDSPHHLGPDKATQLHLHHLLLFLLLLLLPLLLQGSQASRATHLARLIQHNIRRITVRSGGRRDWAGFASWEIEYFTCLFEFYKHWRQRQQQQPTEKEVYQAKKEEENV